MVDDFLRKAAGSNFGSNDKERQVRPASVDPYGDPAESEFDGDVRPASVDPYGDPGDYGAYGDVRPASVDLYGDPADGQNRW